MYNSKSLACSCKLLIYGSCVDKVTNLRITNSEPLPAPVELCDSIPRTPEQNTFVRQSREDLHDLIKGDDRRLLAVVGPCSIHDLVTNNCYIHRRARLHPEFAVETWSNLSRWILKLLA